MAKSIKQHKYTANDVIVSLTSYPARIDTVAQTIESLLAQTLRPHKIVLYLGQDKFPGHKLPDNLVNLVGGIFEIHWIDKDIKSFTKLLPALVEYPDYKIITVDDDILYPSYLFEKLYKTAQRHPDKIICHRTTKFDFKHNQWRAAAGQTWANGAFLNKLTGVGGVLYMPNILHPDVLNIDLAMQLCPTNDDQWFWIQAIRNNIKIYGIGNGNPDLAYVDGTQDVGLVVQNDGGANLFWVDFDRLMRFYPDVDKTLRTEAEQRHPVKKKFKLFNIDKKRNGRRHIYFCGFKIASFKKTVPPQPTENVPTTSTEIRYCSNDRLPQLLRDKFRERTGKLPTEDLVSFREKLIWASMFDVTALKIQCADKLAVRDYVAQTVGDKYLPKLYKVYTRPDEFKPDELPDSFMLTYNAGSGQNKIITNRNLINTAEIRELIRDWLQYNHSELFGEMQYRPISPCVIARELVDIRTDVEYKLWCFGGRVEFIVLNSYKSGHRNIRVKTKNTDWTDAGFYQISDGFAGEIEEEIERPAFLDEMIDTAQKLAAPFDFVRVDFYETKSGELMFGELTFSPTAGNVFYAPNNPAAQYRLGQLFKIPPRDENGFAKRG